MSCGCKNAESCRCSTMNAEEKYDCGCINHGDDDYVGCESCGYESCLDCHHIDSTDRNVDNWKCYEGYGCNKGMNAEEPMVEEPDFIPNGDGRVIGQQDFAINLTPLHAESEDESCSVCDGDVDTEEDIGRYTRCESCHKPFHNQTVCGFEGGIHTCVKCLNTLNSDKPHLLEDFEIEHLDEYNKSRKNAESFNAESKCDCDRCERGRDGHYPMGWTCQYTGVMHRYKDAEGNMIKVSATLTPDFWEDVMNGDESINEVEWNIENAESFNAESKCGCGCSIGNCQCPKGCKCGCGDHKAESFEAQPDFNEDMNELVAEVKRLRDGIRLILSEETYYDLEVFERELMKLIEYNHQQVDYGAETTGSPSPTFNEDITGQDGPSANPTNQEFEAMTRFAPSKNDVETARRKIKAHSSWGEVIYDRYLVNQQGSSNKFYYTAISEKDGRYYPLGAWGRIGYMNTVNIFNALGKKENPSAHLNTMKGAYNVIQDKELSKINARKSEKRYVDSTLTKWDAESLSEIEGPTAEATAGGLHSPSSFDMTWEDGSGQSSASIPPNEIAWAENTGFPTWAKLGAGIAVLYGAGKVITSKMSEQKSADNLKSAIKARKGCCGKSAETKTVRKDSEYSVGQINPVEVEGQSDVHGAEEVQLSKPHQGPQSTHYSNERPSQKMW